MNVTDIPYAIRPWMVWSGVVLLAVLVGLVFVMLQSDSESGFSMDQGSVRMRLSEVTLVHGQEGRKLWELSAKESIFHQDNGSVSLTDPRFAFRLAEREETVTVSASQGRLSQDRRAVRLWPDVQVRREGSVLKASSMEYQESEQALIFTGDVRLLDPRMRVSSRKARINLQNRDLSLWDEVRVVLQ